MTDPRSSNQPERLARAGGKSWDGLSRRQFALRVLFSIGVTAAVGLAAFFSLRFLSAFHR